MFGEAPCGFVVIADAGLLAGGDEGAGDVGGAAAAEKLDGYAVGAPAGC